MSAKLLRGGLTIAEFFVFCISSNAQTVFELTCPETTSSIQPAQTINPVTGKGRQNICVDASGNWILNNPISTGTAFIPNINGLIILDGGATYTFDTVGLQAAINALPSLGGKIIIPQSVSLSGGGVTVNKPLEIECSNLGQFGSSAGTINYVPATGTAISVSSVGLGQPISFSMHGCNITTSSSTTSKALSLAWVNQSNIYQNYFSGFNGGGISVTGNGTNGASVGVKIHDMRIDGFCGSSSYAINADHVLDLFIDKVESYSTSDCATSQPLILDTDVGGAWITNNTWEQGLHSAIIRSTNQGGSFGGPPSALFISNNSFDFAPGGSDLLLDSTLGTSNTQLFCVMCWAKAAGKNSVGTVTTSAIGIDIEGGSNINFWAGTVSKNSGWGIVVNSSGQNFKILGTHVVSNNQGNTANIGGIQITANPSNWYVQDVRSGNSSDEPGGNQAYGLDASLSSVGSGFFAFNDFKGNTTARTKLSGLLGTLNVDIPEIGSSGGIGIHGGVLYVEGNCPNGTASSDIFCGDSSSHAPKVNANNSGLHFSMFGERGTATCSTGTIAVTFSPQFASAPIVVISDQTTTGGARISTGPSNTGFTITCTGASDVVAWIAVGNPN